MHSSFIPYSQLQSCGYDLSTPDAARFVEMCKRVEALLASIATEFREVPAPRITLHVARAYDDEWGVSKERGEELKAKDFETSWQEVSDSKIEDFQEYFTFSDSEGWRFYLPAFMCHFLRDFPNGAFVAVCTAVRRPGDRLELLTEGQRRCVDEFRELCDSHHIWSP
ncbi:hypothetical protein OJ996_23225 [Luteolibacter sp. GHJ8]|uniref:Uncharacterized protein n=1 Tax=Luteolibacter rhizosphaerae TaxID=2989719 RepID=A0ABT3G9J3_9BACT|nr:DUF6714 family protein [Luteolibacter rhizosphaerae]MCW1916518.1 hypothetical protein [Luteolibacter rhizosphaerae]